MRLVTKALKKIKIAGENKTAVFIGLKDLLKPMFTTFYNQMSITMAESSEHFKWLK